MKLKLVLSMAAYYMALALLLSAGTARTDTTGHQYQDEGERWKAYSESERDGVI